MVGLVLVIESSSTRGSERNPSTFGSFRFECVISDPCIREQLDRLRTKTPGWPAAWVGVCSRSDDFQLRMNTLRARLRAGGWQLWAIDELAPSADGLIGRVIARRTNARH